MTAESPPPAWRPPLPARLSPSRGWVWLVVVYIVLYGRLLLGWCPAGGDLVNQYLPYQQLIRAAVRAGELPLYNALTFCGRPLMADIQVGVLYPPNWLHWLLPLPLSFALVVALHGALQLWGCWRLGRALEWHPIAIVLAATLFASSPFFLLKNNSGVVLFLYAGAWWPWLAWAFVRRRWLLLPWLFALSLLCGAPQITYYGWLAVGMLALAWPAPSGRAKLADLARLALCAVAGLGLTALQTAQTYAFIQHSFERGGGGAGWDYITDGSLAPRLLWLLVNPALLGDYTRQDELYWGKPPDFAEGCYHLPVWAWAVLLPLALALMPWRAATLGDRRRRALALLGVLGALLALGLALGKDSPLFRAAYAAVPGFDRFRVPARLMSLWTAGVALLAGLGAEALIRSGPVQRRRILLVTLSGLTIGAVLLAIPLAAREALWRALGNPLPLGRADLLEIATELRQMVTMTSLIGLFMLLACAGAVLVFVRRRSITALSVPVVLALAGQVYLAESYQVLTRFGDYTAAHYPHTALVELLQREARGGRVLWLDDVHGWQVDQNQPEIYPNRLIMHGLAEARGYDPVNARWIGEWMNLLAGLEPDRNPRGFMFVSQVARPAWLTLMGVELVLSYQDLAAVPGLRRIAALPFPEGALNLYRNTHFRGMAFAAPMPRVAPDETQARYASAALANDPSTDPLRTIVLPPMDFGPEPLTAGPVGPEFQLEPTVAGNHRFAWRVRFPQGALFCFAQSAWPGWTAWIDGELAPWGALSGSFLAVGVPAGEHEVVFAFEPEGWALGKLISLTALVAVGYVTLRTWRARRKRGTSSQAEVPAQAA